MGIKKKFTLVDVLISIIVLFSAVVASPYVIRQFMDLTKPGDILWNISLDVVYCACFLLVAYTLDKLLNRFL